MRSYELFFRLGFACWGIALFFLMLIQIRIMKHPLDADTFNKNLGKKLNPEQKRYAKLAGIVFIIGILFMMAGVLTHPIY
jgi:hypothetical protein